VEVLAATQVRHVVMHTLASGAVTGDGWMTSVGLTLSTCRGLQVCNVLSFDVSFPEKSRATHQTLDRHLQVLSIGPTVSCNRSVLAMCSLGGVWSYAAQLWIHTVEECMR
jgi:hypothetical protein